MNMNRTSSDDSTMKQCEDHQQEQHHKIVDNSDSDVEKEDDDDYVVLMDTDTVTTSSIVAFVADDVTDTDTPIDSDTHIDTSSKAEKVLQREREGEGEGEEGEGHKDVAGAKLEVKEDVTDVDVDVGMDQLVETVKTQMQIHTNPQDGKGKFDEVYKTDDTVIHTILLDELFTATNDNDVSESLQRLWNETIEITKTKTTTTSSAGTSLTTTADENKHEDMQNYEHIVYDTSLTSDTGFGTITSSTDAIGISRTSIIDINTNVYDETCLYFVKESSRDIFYSLGGYSILLGIMKKYLKLVQLSDTSTNANHQRNIQSYILVQCLALIAYICSDYMSDNNNDDGDDDDDDATKGQDDDGYATDDDDDVSIGTELITHTVYAGTIPCIFQVMAHLPTNEAIQIFGLDALMVFLNNTLYSSDDANFEDDNDGDDDEEEEEDSLCDKIVKQIMFTSANATQTGFDIIVAAMKTFPTCDMIQDYGCSIVYEIAAYNDSEFIPLMINTTDIVTVLASAIENYKNCTTCTGPIATNRINIHTTAKSAMLELL